MKKLTFLICFILCLGLAEGQLRDIVSFSNFSNPVGALPEGSLVRSGNVLYGMTNLGGMLNGNIFSVDTDGTNYKNLWNFDGGGDTNGSQPDGSLILSGGVLYGMTYQGGRNSVGNIFKINTDGTGYKDLWDCGGSSDTNGFAPLYSDLTISGNVLYGMTGYGGKYGQGNIFSIHTDGSGYRNLWDFHGWIDTNGDGPNASLIISGNVLYGMTTVGGINHNGNVFSINTNGTGYRDIWNFDSGVHTNGSQPMGSLTLSGNVLYGMTYKGGVNSQGNIFKVNTDGHGYADLWDFGIGGTTNGSQPYGSLTLVGGNLYGMTTAGGIDSAGNIFSIDTNGTSYKDLWDFNTVNGWLPYGSLINSGDVLYGMTESGGVDSLGVVFSFKQKGLDVNDIMETTSSIKLYPNPSNGQFTIQSSVVSGRSSVEVYNMLGEKVYSQLSTLNPQLSINLNQPNGVYLYRVLNEDGSLVGEGKVVIQK